MSVSTDMSAHKRLHGGPTSQRPFGPQRRQHDRLPRTRQHAAVANTGVTDDVPITLHMRRPDDRAVSIVFDDERVTLEFYDVESLERLRDLADEGARRLHAAIEMHKQSD